MPTRIVQSKQNARLKELRRALSNPGREASGLAGIEGPNLLMEAVRANLHISCVFAAQEMEDVVKALRLPPDIEVLLMPRELLNSALVTESPQPIAALVEPPDWTWAHVLGTHKNGAPLVVVLAGIQDPGNVGTILRSAEAFGADGVVCLSGTVNPWNSKAVRASAGSVFRVPVITANEADTIARLHAAGVRIITTSVKGAQVAEVVDLTEPVALLIGNEGNGVPRELAALADCAITIPCPGPVESLNAAVAASVLLYEASRQRSKRISGPKGHSRGPR